VGGTLEAPAWPQLQTTLGTYALTVSPEHLRALEEHVEDRDYEVPAQFTYQGRTWQVQLRYRGRSTRFEPKKPYSVHFSKEDRFLGNVKRLELLAAYKDAGYLTEKLWYDLAASVGLKVPRTRYVHLSLNGQYQGVYTEVENLEKAFLRAHDMDDDSDIYRCGMQDCELRPPPREAYMEPWDKRTNEDQPWDGLWRFIDGINRTPPHAFRAFAEKEVALEDYLTWMVLDTFISNDYQVDSRSYLLYEREQRQWIYVPWDLNNALSLYSRKHDVRQGVTDRASRPLFGFTAYDPFVYELAEWRRSWGEADMKPAWNTLTTRILDDEVLRARYVQRLHQLLETWLTEENLTRRINATHRLLAPFILPDANGRTLDPYVSTEHAARSPEFLRNFVRERRRWLLAHIADIEALGSGPLVIDRVGRDASGAWWVQLYNRGSTPVSLDGLYLSGFTRVPTQSRLTAATVEPGGFVTLQQGAAEPSLRLEAALDAQRPELSLFAADGRTALDLLWLAPLAPGEAYGRQPRGAETFGPQMGP
jgi:spore coat protein H